MIEPHCSLSHPHQQYYFRLLEPVGNTTITTNVDQQGSQEVPSWHVPSKHLTGPTTVSKDLQPLVAKPPNKFWLTYPTVNEFRVMQKEQAKMKDPKARETWDLLGLDVKEVEIAGVPCYYIIPPGAKDDYLLVQTHGGAYFLNNGTAGSIEGAFVANATKIPVVSISYRMPPDYPYPAAIEDATAVWKEVIKSRDPKKVGLLGTSSGGNLALATTLKLSQMGDGTPLPAALSISTPWSDMSGVGDSYIINDLVDNVLVSGQGVVSESAKLYANGVDLKDPLLSPVYGDLSSFPPTILFTGTRDLFLSNTVRVHRKLRDAGITSDLHVFEGLSHAQWTLYDDPVSMAKSPVPETQAFFKEVTLFFDRHLG